MGDVANHFQLKHMANAETRLVRHNIVHPESPSFGGVRDRSRSVFALPQVASVGATEDQLQASGRIYVTATREYSLTAYG